MGKIISIATLVLSVLLSFSASAQTCDGVCVAKKDLDVLLDVAAQHKCRGATEPTLSLDDIRVVVDKKGRVYGSGAEPYPYTIKLDWCNYQIVSKGHVRIIAARAFEPFWEFQLKPRFYASILPVRVFEDSSAWVSAFDVGLGMEFFHAGPWAATAGLGIRSGSLQGSLDLTDNFGFMVGYGVQWKDFTPTPLIGGFFRF